LTRSEFETLYDRYAKYVHAILIARLPPAQAEDSTQEVFLEAWRKLDQLQDQNQFPAWVAAIARNKAADFFRRRKPQEPLLDIHPAKSPAPDPILDALQKLPEVYRETLSLRFIEGLTGPEIADLTGLTHGSVRVNLSRGMTLLRESLGVKVNA
jgi:RNA polymerase sigma-70 factor (ECF subfamily)